MRRIIIRESRQYLNGDLTVGRVTGNLFFDFGLADVAVNVSGDRVVSVKTLTVDYSIFELISRGIVVDHITLIEPRVHVVRDSSGGTSASSYASVSRRPIAAALVGRCRFRRSRSSTVR